jgi:integrase/recombinase XerD
VRDSKFGKSRLVPLHASAVAALAAYAGQRDRLQPSPGSPAFFVSTVGTALLYCDVCHAFRKIVDATGVGSPRRPRIHDIRR